MAECPAKDQMRATVQGPCAFQRNEVAWGQETLGNLWGSTLGGTGGVFGTGCTMEKRTVRPEWYWLYHGGEDCET